MDDQACPRCKTTKYRNPALKFLVNVCGHSLCENCVDLLFVKGSGSCAECGIPLRRNNFRIQLFEDASVEKEVDIRKRILKDFNKREDDFQTLREYNDYLEEIENIVYNLTNNINIEATKQMIEQYRKENKTLILKNKSKLSKEEELLEDIIENEHQEKIQRKLQIIQEEKEEKSLKIKKKEELIDELMFSDAPAGQIVATHVANTLKSDKLYQHGKTQFSTGIKFRNDTFLPMLPKEENPLYSYSESIIYLHGPQLPAYNEISEEYLSHLRASTEGEKAGGFTSRIACYRALQEAVCDLFHLNE